MTDKTRKLIEDMRRRSTLLDLEANVSEEHARGLRIAASDSRFAADLLEEAESAAEIEKATSEH